jgi:hypothetical protein
MHAANALDRRTVPKYLFQSGLTRQQTNMMFKSIVHEMRSDTARTRCSAYPLERRSSKFAMNFYNIGNISKYERKSSSAL